MKANTPEGASTVPPAPVYVVTVTKAADKGTIPQHAIHEGYTIKGYAADAPRVGEPWYVLRIERNGTKTLGHFTTSLVVGVLHDSAAQTFVVDTMNSRYHVSYRLDTSGTITLSLLDSDSQSLLS